MLQVNGLSKTFGGVKAVQDVTFAVRARPSILSSARMEQARRRCST